MDCKSLICDSQSKTDTIPVFDVRTKDADVAHEASVGKISKEQINYLRTRGLSEDAAKSLIVQGFAADITKELPVEYAVEMNNYLKLSMEKNL